MRTFCLAPAFAVAPVLCLVFASAVLSTGCATSTVCDRHPRFRRVEGQMKQVGLYPSARSNLWIAVVVCDDRTPQVVRQLTTDNTIRLECEGNMDSVIEHDAMAAKEGYPRGAVLRLSSSRPTKWHMYAYSASSEWHLVSSVPAQSIAREVCLIPNPSVTYVIDPMGTRLVFWTEQTVLLPLAVCWDVVTSPVQLILFSIARNIRLP